MSFLSGNARDIKEKIKITTDDQYVDVKYYRYTFMCVATIPYTIRTKLYNNIAQCEVGRHIYKYFEKQNSTVDIIFIYESEENGDEITNIISIMENVCATWWWSEYLLEFRQCYHCSKICKIGMPMHNVPEICNILGAECVECMDITENTNISEE